MANPVLVIGNKNYSSWSLRPWLLLKVNAIAFDEVRVPLYQQHSTAAIQAHAPPGQTPYAKVPMLRDGEIAMWDSLAICEYIAERWPQTHGWPSICAGSIVTRRRATSASRVTSHAASSNLRPSSEGGIGMAGC